MGDERFLAVNVDPENNIGIDTEFFLMKISMIAWWMLCRKLIMLLINE